MHKLYLLPMKNGTFWYMKLFSCHYIQDLQTPFMAHPNIHCRHFVVGASLQRVDSICANCSDIDKGIKGSTITLHCGKAHIKS